MGQWGSVLGNWLKTTLRWPVNHPPATGPGKQRVKRGEPLAPRTQGSPAGFPGVCFGSLGAGLHRLFFLNAHQLNPSPKHVWGPLTHPNPARISPPDCPPSAEEMLGPLPGVIYWSSPGWPLGFPGSSCRPALVTALGTAARGDRLAGSSWVSVNSQPLAGPDGAGGGASRGGRG